MFFDLGLEFVSPKQRIEIITEDNDSQYDDAIESLKELKNRGLLTEEEYKEKLLKLVK